MNKQKLIIMIILFNYITKKSTLLVVSMRSLISFRTNSIVLRTVLLTVR